MTTPRLLQFAVSLVGGWLAGVVGAFVVWGNLYGIGARVISDDTYYRLEGTVVWWGGIAGALVAIVVILSLRRPAPGTIVAGHMLATIAGFYRASSGWQEALWAYFGVLAGFSLCIALGAVFRFFVTSKSPTRVG